MLHIILTILKILGCILLGVLALILALILIVLFVPFKYEMSGKYYGSPEGTVKFTWLFGALKVIGEFKDKNIRARVSFFTRSLLDIPKEPEVSQETPEDDFSELEELFEEMQSGQETIVPDDQKPSEPVKTKDKPVVSKEEPVRKEPDTLKKEKIKTSREKIEEKPESSSETWMDKIDHTLQKLKQKLESLSKNKEKISRFINAECTQNSIRFAKKALWSVFMYIRPKKISGYLHFGLGRPSDTGKVLGYASIFYALYGESVVLNPDFEQEIIEGDLYIKGSIPLYIFVYWGLRSLLNKDIRNLVKYIRNMKG